MTPIEKNVIVVDEQGNEYEATYPKRAKGLVKNGRARFIDENKICLACPPKNETEDNKMSDNIVVNEEIGEVIETNAEYVELTVEYCLKQIREIQKQTEYLNDVILKLGETYATGPEDIVGQARAQALCDVVKCRETTNQRLIAFYEKMYDDAKPSELNAKQSVAAKDIFDKIVELQKQITENSYYSLHRLDDCITSLYDREGVSATGEEIEEVCSVFKEREKTLMKMLEMYERMYNDLSVTIPEIKSIELVKLSVSAELELIKSSEMASSHKLSLQKAAIEKGRTRMLDVILRSRDTSKQRVTDEMTDIPESPQTPQNTDQ